MTNRLLLPHRFRTIGWMLLTPALLYGIATTLSGLFMDSPIETADIGATIFSWLGIEVLETGGSLVRYTNAEHWINNILIFCLTLGGLFVGCTREKHEDEMFAQLRLESLLTALWINYALLLAISLVVYDLNFLYILICNLFTFLLIFVGVFRYKVWRLKRKTSDATAKSASRRKFRLLLPHCFRTIGWVLLTPALLYTIYYTALRFLNAPLPDPDTLAQGLFTWLGIEVKANGLATLTNAEHWINNILIFCFTLGGLFVGCAREKHEDEMFAQLRLESLLMALWINYTLLLAISLVVYNNDYADVMLYNIFTPLLIFVGVFRYKVWRLHLPNAQDMLEA